MWTLKTFYHYSNRHYALCIHDDGTLTQAIEPRFSITSLMLELSIDPVPILAFWPNSQIIRAA
jgi:hypothetical protein